MFHLSSRTIKTVEMEIMQGSRNAITALHSDGMRIWIDLENTPHIPFFRPIIRELRDQGHHVLVSARDCYQTCEMASFYSMVYRKIGHHYGRNPVAKSWGLLVRSLQLMRFAAGEHPRIALNLGSRSQNLAAKLLGIPVVEIMDYEYTADFFLLRPRWYLIPNAVDGGRDSERPSSRTLTYDGIKEDVYVPDFVADERILDHLGLRGARIIVTARPPATEAHYHNPEAEQLFARFINRALEEPGVITVLLPRNSQQAAELRIANPHWFSKSNLVVPKDVIDGLNLIWHSDLVVSGGGTMNREAAALGVPVYSVFRGPTGAVDLQLSRQHRLTLIQTADDVDEKIRLCPRSGRNVPDGSSSQAFKDILNHLYEIIRTLQSNPEKGVVAQRLRNFRLRFGFPPFTFWQ